MELLQIRIHEMRVMLPVVYSFKLHFRPFQFFQETSCLQAWNNLHFAICRFRNTFKNGVLTSSKLCDFPGIEH